MIKIMKIAYKLFSVCTGPIQVCYIGMSSTMIVIIIEIYLIGC